MSGTSMASFNVANVAAKILAVILKTAEKTAEGRRNLIDPKKALAVLRAL
jgi:hypothetical protein